MPELFKICYATAELSPFAKVGGLADVSYALPRQLGLQGHDLRAFSPLHAIIDRQAHPMVPVDFLRKLPLRLGTLQYFFSVYLAELPGSTIPVYFIDCPELFDRPSIYTAHADEAWRFSFFSQAVLECCRRMDWRPDLLHCHDWHTALIPFLLKTAYGWDDFWLECHTLQTIHNIGYQGVFSSGFIRESGLEKWTRFFDPSDTQAGRLNFLRSGLLYADAVSTVSPTHANEIQTREFGMGMQELLRARSDVLVGILNGVDYSIWSPECDARIPHNYSAKQLEGKRKNKLQLLRALRLSPGASSPLLGIVSRLSEQKGFELCFEVLPQVLTETGARLAVLGTGEPSYEDRFKSMQDRFPGQVAFYHGYDDDLAHLIEAGSDIFLMPSRYEPCGLNQMFSLRYGTIPIVRKTGGLADSVRPFDKQTGKGTGFLFSSFTARAFDHALRQALDTYRDLSDWSRLMSNAMAEDFSWERQARCYHELYSWIVREA